MDQSIRYKAKAGELRERAEKASTSELAQHFLDLAKEYDALAERDE
jgi:hypothetical protein